MFTITSTRIVGLIAVVCAVVAPQALAAPSTHNTVSVPGDPSDVIQRYELRGEVSDQGFTPTAFAAVPSQSPMGQPANNTPGGFDLGDLKDRRAAFTPVTHKNVEAGSRAAAIKALQRRSVDLNAAYRKLYPGAYRHGSMQTNPGWGAAATQAKTPAAEAAVKTAPVVCLGYAEYEYVYSGCAG